MMKKMITMSMILLFAVGLFAGTNVEVNQFRWNTVEWSGAQTVTLDSATSYTSDAFYIGDGNLQPEVFGLFIIEDISSESFIYSMTLLESYDGVNYITTGSAVLTTDTLTTDRNSIVEFTSTNVPFARWGKIVATPTTEDSTIVLKVLRGAVY